MQREWIWWGLGAAGIAAASYLGNRGRMTSAEALRRSLADAANEALQGLPSIPHPMAREGMVRLMRVATQRPPSRVQELQLPAPRVLDAEFEIVDPGDPGGP